MRGEAIDDHEAAPGAELIRWQSLGPLAFVAGAQQFRADYAVQVFEAENRLALAREVASAFAAERIEVVLIKGISYSGDLYPDRALRPMGDIDLLVRPEDRARGFRILEELGFVDGTTGGATELHHAWQLSRSADRRSVDLHRNIVQPWRSAIDLDEVWARAEPATDVPGARRLSRIDQVLFHWAHVARHELWVGLTGYVDSIRLVDRLSERERASLWERARRYQLYRGCRAAWAMTRALENAAESSLPAWGRALPSRREVLSGKPPARPIQLVRKAILNDSWTQLARVAAVFASRRARAWWQRR
jgi:hypothetical protein